MKSIITTISVVFSLLLVGCEKDPKLTACASLKSPF